MITALNIINSILLFLTIVLLLCRWIRSKDNARFVLFITFFFLFISTLFNVPEHILITSQFDEIEVLFDILFLPSLILVIHITTINRELVKRKISEQRFRAIFNQAFSLMGLLDKDGGILETNERALKMVDVTNEQIKKMPFYESKWWMHSVAEQNKLKAAINEAKKGETVRFETTNINNRNQLCYMDVSITPIFSDLESPVNFIVEGRDITELKDIQVQLEDHKNNLETLVKEQTGELEATNEELKAINDELYFKNNIIKEQNEELKVALNHLREAQSQLVQAEKMASLGTLTAGVAHEINNPLNYIMGAYCGLEAYFAEHGSKDEGKTSILLSSIKVGVDRAAYIVQGLNQFSRNNICFNEVCDIHAILNNCLAILNNQIKQKISIVENFTDRPAIIKGNVGKLHQAFLNIFTNSIQSIKNEGEITITTKNDGENIMLEILDNGCGIREEDMKQIIDPFFTTKPPGEGTGLGLAITYSIIKKHKGFIRFESEINKGTKVSITLPHISE